MSRYIYFSVIVFIINNYIKFKMKIKTQLFKVYLYFLYFNYISCVREMILLLLSLMYEKCDQKNI